jgi:hypothetical protein
MKTIADLAKLVVNGAKPVVQFSDPIGDKESYADEGMRARAVGIDTADSQVIKVTFDFSEFDAFNLPFEKAHYFDKAGNPTLTARKAGFYRPQDNLYFDPAEVIEGVVTLVADERSALFTGYLATGTTETYISWLETKVLNAAA